MIFLIVPNEKSKYTLSLIVVPYIRPSTPKTWQFPLTVFGFKLRITNKDDVHERYIKKLMKISSKTMKR